MLATVESPARSKTSTVMRGSPFQIATEGFSSKHKEFEFSVNGPKGKRPRVEKTSVAATANSASHFSSGMGISTSAHHHAKDHLALIEDLAAPTHLARRTKTVAASSRVSAATAMPGPVAVPGLIHSSPSLSLQAQTPSQTPDAPQNSSGESDQPSNLDSTRKEPKFVNPEEKLPTELLDEIFKSVTKEKRITIIPEVLARRSMEKLPLTYCTGGALLGTTRRLRVVYQDALQTRAHCADFDKITFHVLNFDFQPFITHFFPKVQEENVTRMCNTPIAIELVFNEKFLTRLPEWNGYIGQYLDDDTEDKSGPSAKARAGLNAWLGFLANNQRAHRGLRISEYECIKMGSTPAELAELSDAITSIKESLDGDFEFERILRGCYAFEDAHWV